MCCERLSKHAKTSMCRKREAEGLTRLSELESKDIKLVIKRMFVRQTKTIMRGGPRIGEI